MTDRDDELQALLKEVQAQRARLDEMRGVYVNPRAASYEPLTPLYKIERAARLREQRLASEVWPRWETAPPDPEQERKRKQVVYWLRRVHEEERVCIELQEDGSEDLASAQARLKEAIDRYAGIDPDRDGIASPRDETRPRGQQSANTPPTAQGASEPSLLDRAWNAVKSLWN